jgi:hypothetical protein
MFYSLFTGAIVGGCGFLLGFIGPIIFATDANQGPLLGIFITGPVSAIIGFLFGVYLDSVKRKTGATDNKAFVIWKGVMWTGAILIILIVLSGIIYIPYYQLKKSPFVDNIEDIQSRSVSLTELSVRCLKDNDIKQLGKFYNLETLNFWLGSAVCEDNLTDEGLKSLAKLNLKNLHSLTLGDNKKITDTGINYLKNMHSLTQVWLLGDCSGVTELGVQELSNSLPDADIRKF